MSESPSEIVIGHGIDAIEPDRIARSIENHGERFIERVFTAAERAYCEDTKRSAERFAARFAAKEAAVKALGFGMRRGMSWTDLEVVRDSYGKPSLALHGPAAEALAAIGGTRTLLSLTHTASVAMASVIVIGTAKL